MKHLNTYENKSFNLKSLTSYKNESFNMKPMSSYITEYIVKKKLDKFIDSEHNYKYFPETKEELIASIKELLSKGEINLNYIDTSNITDMSHLFETLNISTKSSNVSRLGVLIFLS